MTSAELEQLVAQIGEEILARMGRPAPPAREGLNIPDLVCPGCVQRCVQTCAKKSREIVQAGAERVADPRRHVERPDEALRDALQLGQGCDVRLHRLQVVVHRVSRG